MDNLNEIHLRNLSAPAKLFVGIFTALMLLVCFWAMFILYVDVGMVGPDDSPSYLKQGDAIENHDDELPSLKHNIGMAHTHINGQTLLFFALGLLFVFSSASPKVKKVTLWLFGIGILFHAIGWTGRHYHWFFDDALAISGLVILVMISFMALHIFVALSGEMRT